MDVQKVDHFAEAERLLVYAASPGPGSVDLAANVIARAQAHATLAVATETAALHVCDLPPAVQGEPTLAARPAINAVHDVLDHAYDEISSALSDIPDCESWTASPHAEHAQGEQTEAAKKAFDRWLAQYTAEKRAEWEGEKVESTRLIDNRDAECVEVWPGCHDFGYDPACCRFPKSCSAGGFERVPDTTREFAPGECDGSGECSAPIHVHGCYTPHRSDQCDSPNEYGHIDSESEGKA